jgi:hypothetical protein
MNSSKKSGGISITCAMVALLTIAMAFSSAQADASEVSIGNAHATGNGPPVVLPVLISNATNLGSIDLELAYNHSVLMVTNVSAGDFDVMIPNLETNATGCVRIVAFQTESPGLNGTIVLARLTLRAVGDAGSSSPLNITVNKMTDATPQCRDVPFSVTNGTFTVLPTPTPAVRGGSAHGLRTGSPSPTEVHEPEATITTPAAATPALPGIPPASPSAPVSPSMTTMPPPTSEFPGLPWHVVPTAILIAVTAIVTALLLMRKKK